MNDELDALTKPYLHKSIQECSLEEIKSITQKYPYFVPAQLALLKKLKLEQLPEYDSQLQKAVLYFYDPLQFNAFVDSQKFITEFDFSAVEIDTQEEDEVVEATPIEQEPVAIDVPATEENEPPFIEEPEVQVPQDEPLPDTTEAVTVDEVPKQVEPTNTTELENTAIAPSAIATETTSNEQPTSDELVFEPYHTVDYFASQGIKLSQEEATDRVGKQLKSFTQWLRTMKRLPVPEVTNHLDPATEHQVQDMAAHSLTNTDIVTETMAEVWAKQGNLEKAIQVYNKLSLQNPSKRAYFASKIDNLTKAP